MLDINGLTVKYAESAAVRELSLSVAAGEVVCLFGRNGAGKTTTLKAIMGQLPADSGSILFNGIELTGMAAHEVPKCGIGYVPQGRRLFAELTVRENLEIGLMTRKTPKSALEAIFKLFPRLKERLGQISGTLSGGEQQMLAMARALALEPSLILLDEPTEGLMPSMIATIRDVILQLKNDGKAILLVEQRVDAVLPVADRICIVENGRVQAVSGVEAIREDPALLRRYAGIG